MTTTTNNQDNNLIRSMVRGVYALQQLRVQMGNRITVNFKSKLGLTQDGMSEKDLAKQEKTVLDRLRKSYNRITDGIVVEGKLPTQKKFQGDELISSYTELVLVEQYMSILRDEEKSFARLTTVMEGIPVYDQFLSQVRGIGPAMAGIILSEIDIYRAEYSSSLWAYAGLDVVTTATYTDDNGKEHTVSASKINAHFDQAGENAPFYVDGKYLVKFGSVGRSRKEISLVVRDYVNKDGAAAQRNSITYNPFLKTKLIGVLGTSFLRSGYCSVDGARMGEARRLAMAKEEGYVGDVESEEDVRQYLTMRGHTVVNEPSQYAAIYYEYRNRLNNMPAHNDKSDGHKHAMSIRYMVKRFLVDLYKAWRAAEGLPVAAEYSEAKLGKVHKKA